MKVVRYTMATGESCYTVNGKIVETASSDMEQRGLGHRFHNLCDALGIRGDYVSFTRQKEGWNWETLIQRNNDFDLIYEYLFSQGVPHKLLPEAQVEVCYSKADGYGNLTRSELIVRDLVWDWSHIRDSSEKALDQVATTLKEFIKYNEIMAGSNKVAVRSPEAFTIDLAKELYGKMFEEHAMECSELSEECWYLMGAILSGSEINIVREQDLHNFLNAEFKLNHMIWNYAKVVSARKIGPVMKATKRIITIEISEKEISVTGDEQSTPSIIPRSTEGLCSKKQTYAMDTIQALSVHYLSESL